MFLAEMFGTMVLILLGDGVVANVLLNKSKGQNGGWIVITAGWAFAVMCGVFTSSALGGPGSLNPAGEIALTSTSSAHQPPFVGRRREFELLDAAFEDAQAGDAGGFADFGQGLETTRVTAMLSESDPELSARGSSALPHANTTNISETNIHE